MPPQAKPDMESLQFILHSGTPTTNLTEGSQDWAARHNSIDRSWANFWEKIYQEAGTPESFVREDFRRQNAISSLFFEEQYVGSLYSTFFDLELDSDVEHRYFRFYTPEFFEQLKKKGARRVMSVEFLMVLPQWRRQLRKFALSEVLIGLSTKVFNSSRQDALIGTARMDLRVQESCYKFGFERVDGPLNRRNFQVELVAAFRGKTHQPPSAPLAEAIEFMWSRRMDLTGLTQASIANEIKKIAA